MAHVAQAVFTVPDITCRHCQRTISDVLTAVAGVRRVDVNVPAKQVQVDYDEALVDVQRMTEHLQAEEYPVTAVRVRRSRAGRPETGEKEQTIMATTAIDPVCGMTVDPQRTRHTSEYEGQTYYFCAPGCKRAFQANPQQYLATSAAGAGCSCCSTGPQLLQI